ncbi:MAG TPA: PLDc N-terminal domain-containing protein [Acidimicrobiia bacterium]
MRFSGSELFLIVVVLIPTVWALFDALQTSSDVWAASKQDQAVWVLVVLLLPVVGAIMFFLVARPRLNQVR